MKTNLVRLSRDLKQVLRSNAALSILDPWGVGWTDGGCLVLANALRRWLDAGDVMGVWEPVPLGDDIQHHAVLTVGDWLLDGNGVSSDGGLLKKWGCQTLRGGVELREFDWDVAQDTGVETDPDMEDEVVRLLDSEFNRTAVLEALKKTA